MHCLPYTVYLVPYYFSYNTSGTSSTLYARVCTHTFTHRYHVTINDYNRYARSSNERQLHEEQLHEEQLHEETVLSRSLCRLLNKASHLTA